MTLDTKSLGSMVQSVLRVIYHIGFCQQHMRPVSTRCGNDQPEIILSFYEIMQDYGFGGGKCF